MNTQIAFLDGKPCVLRWYDCHKQKPRDVMDAADLDCSMVYERSQITAQGIKPPEQPSHELLYTHAVATFRDEEAA